MTGKDLLLALGGINGEYIEDAENGALPAPAKKRPRLLLIAAIVALTLVLVGCAAAILLNLDALRIGEQPYVEYARYNEEGEKTPASEGVEAVLSLQGIEGSPNQQAAQEWFQFRRGYDPEHKLWTGEFQAPPEYEAYGVYTQEMVDKLEEIFQKYNLKPEGRCATEAYADWELVQTALGIDGFLKEGAQAQERYDGGHLWECGDFSLLFGLTLQEGWEHEILVNYLYCGKAYFNDLFAAVDPEKTQQWNLTLEDGTELLVVSYDGQASILCDREDAFRSVGFETVYDNYVDGTHDVMSQADIERVARVIDFSLQSHPIEDMDWVENRVEENAAAVENWTEDPEVAAERKRVFEENERKDSYAELVVQIRDNPEYFETKGVPYLDFWETADYALMDVTGDGEDDLLLGQDGNILDIWTMTDGKTDKLQGTWATGNLCEGNVFRHYDLLDGAPYYWFFDLADDGASIEDVHYERSSDSWYHEDYRARREKRKSSGGPGTTTTTTTTGGEDPRVVITEEEANEIVQSYTLIPVEMTPVKEFPMP